jgi:16S rRNA (guanine527-N7)-methyltransferase
MTSSSDDVNVSAGLRTLASRFGVGGGGLRALAAYRDLLAGWTRANVTGIRDRDEIERVLFGDALALLAIAPLDRDGGAGLRLLDLGSGGGIPGIPLAVARVDLDVVLLDAVRKKCAFLEVAARTVGLAGRVHVVCDRCERFTAAGAPGREAFGVVVARAVGSLALLVELAAPALRRDGRLLAPKSASAWASERAAGDEAAAACGLSTGTALPLVDSPVPGSVCVVYRKRRTTPAWLPRREGLAGRRPLPA